MTDYWGNTLKAGDLITLSRRSGNTSELRDAIISSIDGDRVRILSEQWFGNGLWGEQLGTTTRENIECNSILRVSSYLDFTEDEVPLFVKSLRGKEMANV